LNNGKDSLQSFRIKDTAGSMNKASHWILGIWLAITIMPAAAGIVVGWFKLWLARRRRLNDRAPLPHIQILIPIKGRFPGQEEILEGMFEQDYPHYNVTFILESETDSAMPLVDGLCGRHGNGDKIIAGLAGKCAQKNHNLIAGIAHLRPETEIVVFCDSTNAPPDRKWLERFSYPVRSGRRQVVTTFRIFKPETDTIAAYCQTIYGAIMRFLASCIPFPWGGGTCILRKTLEGLELVDDWSKTVVDDLVLGNALKKAGIRTVMEPACCLITPIKSQNLPGYLNFFDRQVMFPKFTNPGLWTMLVLIYTNLALGMLASVAATLLAAAAFVDVITGLIGLSFLILLVIVVLLLRATTPFPTRFAKWLLALPPCIFLNEFVVIRSVFRNFIDWHGRRYWPGKNGIILRITSIR
jgi:ceramide glucosyltransferase